MAPSAVDFNPQKALRSATISHFEGWTYLCLDWSVLAKQ